MTRLFTRFYLCVLIVLFLAWWIHGAVWRWRAEADTAQVILIAHRGGARLVARELNSAAATARQRILADLRQRFAYPVDVIALTDLPASAQREIHNGEDVAYARLGGSHVVVAALAGGTEVVRLGPLPNYELRQIEDAIGGWMRLTADKLAAAPPDERQAVLRELQRDFVFPIEIVGRKELPPWPQGRIDSGESIVFYPQGPPTYERWMATTPLADGARVVRFGPFPSFENVNQKAAATTLALILLPVAAVIALLLRPLARQLRHIERAALSIAAGDLTARVDERRVTSAMSLAQAFNYMAGHTETLVRTQRELLQAVSHELRTPLSRIRFAGDLLATARDDEERRRRLEILEAATDELDELVGELLSYVRLETSPHRCDVELISLRGVLDVVIPRHAAACPAIQFQVDEGITDNLVVVAERMGLQRVVGNLLSNAGRFAGSRVIIRAQSAAGVTTVDVDDDGPGIPESERERVFQPFVRLQNDSPDRGVGLGLAIVKRIVAQHGGTAQALPNPLGGCRIRTTWPAQA
ncbi:MAG: HAMP domain-containing protein [Phycisphaerae bacterium]|nr:HAMP domain-containing protein [Phycisphaerae bacterium]